MKLEKLYPIADRAVLEARGIRLVCFAGEMARAGVKLLQYRDKGGRPQTILRAAEQISELFAGIDATLIMNDRADLAVLAGWSGVHLGQKDMSACDARRVLMAHPRAEDAHEWGMRKLPRTPMIVGVSTHTGAEVLGAEHGCGDYVAIGPVFATSSKADAEPVVGLEGVRRARALTTKPLVAIGGITRENARSVIEAGADSVAVIGGLFVPGMTVREVAEDFLEILR